MAIDASADLALLVQAKYEEFIVAGTQLGEYNRAVHQWYQGPFIKTLFNWGYPQLDDEVRRRAEKSHVVDALRQQPTTYPLRFIWSHERWNDKRFWYGFEHFINGHQFVVEYSGQTITAQLTDKDEPLIEVREDQQDPLLHLPEGFKMPVYTTAYDDYSCPRRAVSRYAYWAPQLKDTPSTITIPEGAIGNYRWAKTREKAPIYRRTQVIPAV